MRGSAGGRSRIGRAVRAVSLGALAFAALPSSALGVTHLGTTTQTVTIGAGVHRSCLKPLAAGTHGVAIRNWVAKADGAVRVRLAGGSRDDWDLALFRTDSGLRLAASQAWGANEVVEGVVRKGQSLTIQMCRLSGVSARLPLEISEVAAPVVPAGSLTPKESLVEIPVASQADFSALENLDINLNEVPNGNVAPAVIGPGDAEKIRAAGYTYRTLIPDVAKAERGYRAREATAAQAGASELPSGRNEYRQYEDIQADLKKLVDDHPGMVRPITLPKKTFQGRDITGVEVSDNVGAADDGKPTFFLMGVHHAREWPSAEIPLEFGIYLTTQFGSDERVTNLLKRVRIVIVPVINIDGYIASRGAVDPADNSGDPQGLLSLGEAVAPPGGNLAYRRKNCHGESDDPSTPCEVQYGVDPNRNYGQYWGGPGAGTDPNSQTYRGSDQWSEPETQAVHEFSRTHDVTTLITMHNFASLVLRPPGRHTDGLAPDEEDLKKLGDRMGDDTGYISEYGFQLYDTSGTTEDWNYAAAGTFGYTIEMGPSADKGGNFHISYDRAVVNQWTGSETQKGKGKGLRDALLAAGEAGASDNFSTLRGTAPPDSVLRLHKDFDTPTSDPICLFETTSVDCVGGVEPGHAQKDFLDYTTVVPPSGKFSWIVTPSTRPFAAKSGAIEKWTLTCEDPVTKKVQETREIVVDRGQTLALDLPCGARPATITSGDCVDKRKLRLRVHRPSKRTLRRIVVFVNGKRTATLKGKRARKGRLTLSKLRPLRGRYRVTVIAYASDGYRRISTRVYKGCKKGKPRTRTFRGGKR